MVGDAIRPKQGSQTGKLRVEKGGCASKVPDLFFNGLLGPLWQQVHAIALVLNIHEKVPNVATENYFECCTPISDMPE
jgi:hypothetical protein